MHQNKNQNKNTLHVPVLLEQVLTYLAPQAGDSYLDLTAGYGGHAEQIIARTGKPDRAVLVDRDPEAIKRLRRKFKQSCEIVQADFYRASRELVQAGKQFDIILADLGVSSPHLNEDSRGFSFQRAGPLDMRMDQTQELTAEQVVNTWSEADLARALAEYGEEPKARRIAGLIVRHRPIVTTTQLAGLAASAWPGRSRVHPATRTFQALRVVVNDELGQLERTLPLVKELLAPGGRIGVISFHSLEDRLVKQFFAEQAGEGYDAEWRLLTKRPATASASEIVFNPRARSAKFRAAVNIKKPKQKGAYPSADTGKE